MAMRVYNNKYGRAHYSCTLPQRNEPMFFQARVTAMGMLLMTPTYGTTTLSTLVGALTLVYTH
jgi:hypothetical protein